MRTLILSMLVLVSWLCLATGLAHTSELPQTEARELMPGVLIEGELEGSGAHSYRIKLAAGQFANIAVEQRNADLVVNVFGPDAQQISEVNSYSMPQRMEQVFLVAESEGEHRVEVRQVGKKATTARYAVKLMAVRTATAEDRKRFDAQRSFTQALQLLRQEGKESKQKAIEKFQEPLALWRAVGDKREEARTLNHIGLAHNNLREYQKSIDSYTQAVATWQASGDRLAEANVMHDIGTIYSSMGQSKKALEQLEQALSLKREIGETEGIDETLQAIGRVYELSADYANAIKYYSQALQMRRAKGNREAEGVSLHNIGVQYYYLGDYPQALEYYHQALPIRREVGDHNGEAFTLSSIGLVYSDRGHQLEALKYYDQAIALWREVKNKRGEGLGLHNAGGAYKFLGEYQKALEYLNQALKLRREEGDRQGEAQTLSLISGVYRALGDNQKALDYLKLSLPIRRSAGDRRGEGYTLNHMGSTYASLGENQEALTHLHQALSIFQTIGDRDGRATALNGLGQVYSALGDHRQALDYDQQALALFQAMESRRLESATLNNMGTAYASLGDDGKAIEHYSQALGMRQAIQDRYGEAITLANLAHIERRRGQLAQARAHIETALEVIESLRTKVVSQDLRSSYLASQQDSYEFYIDLLMQSPGPGEGQNVSPMIAALALQASERARARSLLEALAEAQADIRQGIDGALLERERTLQQQLNAKAEYLTRLLSGKHTDAQAVENRKEIESLLTQYQDAQAQIRSSSPRYAALTQPQPLSLREIQEQVLDPDTLLLEYSLGQERSYLWAVTPTSITSYSLPKREEIQAAAQRFYELLMAGDKKELRTQVKLAAAELGQILLGPVAAQLDRKRLLVVADGTLQYVPFGALPVPAVSSQLTVGNRQTTDNGQRTTDSRPLIAEHEIVNLPSASVLAVLRKELAGRQPASKVVAVLADPVLQSDDPRVKQAVARAEKKTSHAASPAGEVFSPADSLVRSAREAGVVGLERLRFTRQEAEAIAALANKEQRLAALDFEASRLVATSAELSQYRIVHFATHGLLNSEHPELSGIVLSLVDERGQPQDGFLRLHDIYNLKLGADMVVLSACQTALGKNVRGEGLVGLTRGFMYAGAPRVVASLWNVKDEATAELMKRFYQGILKDKLRPAAALRAAQISMWQEKRWEAPYYWAGFVLQGEWQ